MTRKDYVKIAAVFKDYYLTISAGTGDYNDLSKIVFKELAENMATMLKTDNPRFDRDRFLAACGVPDRCDECQTKDHDQCPMNDNCSCCANTRRNS